MRSLAIGVTALAVMLFAAATASAHTFTIRGDWKLGSFAVKRDGTLRGAIDAFGIPRGRDRQGVSCIVRWPRHGLRIAFYNLGGRIRVGRRSDSSRTPARKVRTGRPIEGWRSVTGSDV